MIELYQLPYSPYCIVIRHLLEASDARFKLINIPPGDRSRIWRLTRERYYQVPLLRDGSQVLFEVDDNSQVLAKYLDQKFGLGLFPAEWEGVQSVLWRYFEIEVESVTFKLNDIHWRKHVKAADRLPFVRHKERRFGRGCLDQWRLDQPQLLTRLTGLLLPCEEMLLGKPFLLGDRPLFVDFDLYGMLGNFLFSGEYELPAAHTRLRAWYRRIDQLKLRDVA
jgi:glutathione S-transferase